VTIRLRPADLLLTTLVGLCLFAWPTIGIAAETRDGPWRLDDQFGTDLISLSVNQRTRYEYLSEQLRLAIARRFAPSAGPEHRLRALRPMIDELLREGLGELFAELLSGYDDVLPGFSIGELFRG